MEFYKFNLTDTPEPGDWEETAREVRGDARQHQEALDQVHLFKLESFRSAYSLLPFGLREGLVIYLASTFEFYVSGLPS